MPVWLKIDTVPVCNEVEKIFHERSYFSASLLPIDWYDPINYMWKSAHQVVMTWGDEGGLFVKTGSYLRWHLSSFRGGCKESTRWHDESRGKINVIKREKIKHICWAQVGRRWSVLWLKRCPFGSICFSCLWLDCNNAEGNYLYKLPYRCGWGFLPSYQLAIQCVRGQCMTGG